jgi:type 1 glutamine amidotransferase
MELEDRFGWKCTYLIGTEANELAGLDALAEADLMIVSMRRQFLPEKELDKIKAYCKTGKPVVGIRTASHAFASRDGKIPAGHAEWKGFDPEIFGGNYAGHHENKSDAVRTVVWASEAGRSHPILTGVRRDEFGSASWLYKVLPLEPRTEPLMIGRAGEEKGFQPVVWTHFSEHGNRVFYTSLGHPDDFANPDFRRLLINGILWSLGMEIPEHLD